MKSTDIQFAANKLKQFWRPGDEIICTRIFRRSDNECYLCGNTPIEWHHVLLNSISSQTIDVELSCVIRIKKTLEEWGSDQKILFFKKYEEETAHLNSLHAGTAGILEFNSNTEEMIQLLSKPSELTYKQVRAIMDHTIKFKEGLEAELYFAAFDLYVDRKYYIYEGLKDHERTDNVEKSIKMAIQRDWEDFQAQENEYARQIYESMSSYPSEEE
jgi:hypothetical protein